MNKATIRRKLDEFVEEKMEFEQKTNEMKIELLKYINDMFKELMPNNDIEIIDVESTTRIFAFELSKVNGCIYHSDKYWLDSNGDKKEIIADIKSIEDLCTELSISLNINLYFYRKQKEVSDFEDIANVADYILRKFMYKCSDNQLAVVLKFCPREIRDTIQNKILSVLSKRRCTIVKEEISILQEEISKSMYETDLICIFSLLNDVINENNDKHSIRYKMKVSIVVNPFVFEDVLALRAKDFQLVLRQPIHDEELASLIMLYDEDRKQFIEDKIFSNISSRRANCIRECISKKIGYDISIYNSAIEKIMLIVKDLAEKSLITISDDDFIQYQN